MLKDASTPSQQRLPFSLREVSPGDGFVRMNLPPGEGVRTGGPFLSPDGQEVYVPTSWEETGVWTWVVVPEPLSGDLAGHYQLRWGKGPVQYKAVESENDTTCETALAAGCRYWAEQECDAAPLAF